MDETVVACTTPLTRLLSSCLLKYFEIDPAEMVLEVPCDLNRVSKYEDTKSSRSPTGALMVANAQRLKKFEIAVNKM